MNSTFKDDNSSHISKISVNNYKEEIDNSMLTNFQILKDYSKSHPYFCSYNFHKDEEYMLDFWRPVITHLLNNLGFQALSLSQLFEYCSINDRIPVGISNIVEELIRRKYFLTSNTINDPKGYLYESDNKTGLVSFLSNKASNVFSYFYGSKDKVVLNEDMLIMETGNYLKNCDKLLNLIDEYCIKHEVNVFTLSHLKEEVNSLDFFKNVDLLILGLTYLQFKGKTLKATVKINSIDNECYKRLSNSNDKFDEKDATLINIQSIIYSLDHKILELEERINALSTQIKEYLLKNNRLRAKQVLAQKKLYEKSLDLFFSKKSSLEEQILQLKSMKNSVEIMNILKDCDKINKLLNSETDDIQDVVEDIRSNLNEQSEKNKVFQYSSEENDEEIENELRELELGSLKEKEKENLNKMSNMKESRKLSPIKQTVFMHDFPSVRKDPSLDDLINDFKSK